MINAEEVKQQFQQASTLFQAQQYQQALEILDHLDDAVPNNQDIMYFKARVLGVLNRNQEASAFCDRLTALGDHRGEQLKAALNVTPAGPPPIPAAQDTPEGSVPPILPGQDTAQSSYEPPPYEPPPFATGRSSNKKMNIIGFSLMGILLLAALIVVIVRSGDSKEDKTTPPPAETQMASVQTEDEGASAETAGETDAPADAEETKEAKVSEETAAEKAQEQPEGGTTTEESVEVGETATSEEPAKPEEPADTPKEEEPVEKTEQEPKQETKEELKEDTEAPKEKPKEEVIKPVFGEEIAKVLQFPEDESLGSVYLRKKGALEREPWERVGEAIGKIGIPPNQDVKVQIEKYHLEPLLKLEPDDIQILSLWDVKVDDKGIEPIKHLKGLKELDIRQTEISPDGWVELQKALPECRILY